MQRNARTGPDGQLYFRGIPVAPDVRKLIEAFGKPKEGVPIPYPEVESVLGYSKESHRFKTVTTSWRAELLRDQNIEIGCDPGNGFVALTPSERVKEGSSKVQKGLRSVVRGGKRLHVIDDRRLDPTEQATRQHRIQMAAHIQQAAATAKAMGVMKPPRSITERNP